MSGLSSINLKYMCKLAKCWQDFEIVQWVVSQLPWRSNVSHINKIQ